MIDETALRDALVASIEESKNQYLTLASILAELEALRETVRGLDPTFADVMEQKRQESVAQNAPFVQAQLSLYEEKLRRVKDGYVC